LDRETLKKRRYRARTDLFWLAKEILGFSRLNKRVHQPICDFFVHKVPGLKVSQQPDPVKKRKLEDPRGHFKTSIDIADIVQWLLIDPDARILIMSGTEKLAKRMLAQVKEAFEKNPRVQALFPEYKVDYEKVNNSEEFTLANRSVGIREPSVSIATIDSAKASVHIDILKADDLVHENNYQTAELLEGTIDAYKNTLPLLEPWGFVDVIGTRYSFSDLYGWIDEQNAGEWKTSTRAACKLIKTDGVVQYTDILFPEEFTEQKLRELHKDMGAFFSYQYLNTPHVEGQQSFTEVGLLRHKIPHHHIPRTGRIFITWDLGFSSREYADFSVGAVGMFDAQGRLFILDVAVGRFSPHELVQQIVALYLRWRPSRVGIEKAAGSELLAPALEMYARQLGIHLPIEWIPVKNTKGAKEERIGSLQPLLDRDRLYFSANIPQDKWDELVKQFVRFPRYVHKDIPDAISMLLQYRGSIDIEIPNDRVEMVSASVFDDGLMGAGLVG